MKIKFLFEPRDIWVGVFWDRRNAPVTHCPTCGYVPRVLSVYICPFPMFVIRLTF